MRFPPPQFTVELSAIKWTEFRWKSGTRRIPGIIILLTGGILFHQVAAGALATGTALVVGFAGARLFCGSRVLAMLGTSLLMAACAFAGTLAGNSYPITLTVSILGGFSCGLLALASDDAGWIVMQGVIAFIAGSYFANGEKQALLRAGCTLIGGLTETLFLFITWRLGNIPELRDETDLAAKIFHPRGGNWFAVIRDVVKSTIGLRYGLRVAITLGLAVEVAHLMNLKSGYWMPMTTLIVLKPDFIRTYTGGVQRVVGTLAGVTLASLAALIFHPATGILFVLVVGSAWGTFAFQNVNPVMFSGCLTFFVVVLIAMTGLPEATVSLHRFIYTLLGCVLALTSHFVGFFIVHRSAIHLGRRAELQIHS